MFQRMLLDEDSLRVTIGPLAIVRVHLKERGITRKCSRAESRWFLQMTEALQARGVEISPKSDQFLGAVEEFAEAMSVPGSVRWRVFFSQSPDDFAANF